MLDNFKTIYYYYSLTVKKSDIFWQTYLNLEKDVIDVSKYIYFTDTITVLKDGVEVVESCETQLSTFSPRIADLLVTCCVQIEAISKELYYKIGGEKPRGDNSILFDEDCLKTINLRWRTDDKKVLVVAPFFSFTKETNSVLRPLKGAYKKSKICWARAYQAVKHDRLYSIKQGNVKALIQALAALYLLNVYYRNDSWVTKIQGITKRDFSMGSSLFAVKPPEVGQLWNDNKPIHSDSPFVICYNDSDYKRIKDIQRSEEEALINFWQKQPELNDPAFKELLARETEKQVNDPTYRIMHYWVLGKYRLQKMIPTYLPFEEKKKMLLESEAWNCWINQNNKHLFPEDLTEDNIDQEIEMAGRRWGMQIQKRLQKLDWVPLAMGEEICRVYIP